MNNTDTTIQVLGKSFDSDLNRKLYFKEELRRMLPELRKIDGFPHGTDDDIIALSDPPYYTACPNPWINSFIEQWENEKPSSNVNNAISEPYSSDVSEGKSNPVYVAHSYHTKVPHPAIMRFILYYTNPGDIVFDGFCGTGMTGVAGQLCGHADDELKLRLEKEFKEKSLSPPNWGERKVICSDLSPMASFISYNYNSKVDLDELNKLAGDISDRVNAECSWMYETIHTDGSTKASINYMVWSDVYSCGNCNEDLVFWDYSVNVEDATILDEIDCLSCGSKQKIKKQNRVQYTFVDPLTQELREKALQVPVLKYYSVGKKKFVAPISDFDKEIIRKIENLQINFETKSFPLPDGYNTRQPIRSHGFRNVHDFYTKRNLIALDKFKKEIAASENKNLLFLLTGMTVRSTMMNRIHLKNFVFGGGGWNAGHRKGTLYVPSISIETSPLVQIKDKLKLANRAFQITKNNESVISTNSATDLNHIDDESIDFMYLDPPFGANINYSELNIFWEATLSVLTNNKTEAIQNVVQKKSLFEYQSLLENSFDEFYRILKPNKWIVVEFSNTKASVWNSISSAIRKSGFIVSSINALDKKQGGMSSIVSVTAVDQDLVISCYKPSKKLENQFNSNGDSANLIWNFIEEHLNHLPVHIDSDNSTKAIVERAPKILFDRSVAYFISRDVDLSLNATDFQTGLRDRFVERDGMFFTAEQSYEYDKKRSEMPRFIQASMFVTSEQDGVFWLKEYLRSEAQTYQNIQPKWMKALASTRKGDVLPELMVILEENFLKDDEGAWYLPDNENEIDLEKLRSKRLLKQYGVYVEVAKTPKGKLKEVRVDALRTGFKQNYKDKDFETIVSVGDRIPNNLLMEDEVLLQFYDIASSRV